MADWSRVWLRGKVSLGCALLIAIGILLCRPSANAASPPPDTSQALAPAAQATPAHSGMAPQERLARPPLSNPPTQIELGHREYWMSCMVCHGDQGQGLTEEWRSVLDPEDMNCWQSKCHAPNHPPEGFEIPRKSPLIIGTGALTGYETATDLYEYMRVEMPWAFPGLFEDKVYWELTAYLADANQIDLGTEPLGPETAGEILVQPGVIQTHRTPVKIEQAATGAVVVLMLGALVLKRWAAPDAPDGRSHGEEATE